MTHFPLRAVVGALLAASFVVACTPAQLAGPVPVAVTQNAQTALDAYQAGLGIAQVALRGNPALLAKINATAAKAAPFIAAVQAGVTDASTAPNLSALAAELLVEAAQSGFKVVPAAPAT